MAKIMDHTAYQNKLKKYSDEQITHVIRDAREAISAMPDGENAGYYSDEIHYCVMELNKRRDRK